MKFQVQFQIQNKMPEIAHLSDIWEPTFTKIVKHDPKSELGIMVRLWVIFNILQDFKSLLNYTDDDFTQSGNLCYSNDNGEILHQTPLQEFFNLRCYIQQLIDQSESDDDEFDNPLSEDTVANQLEIHESCNFHLTFNDP